MADNSYLKSVLPELVEYRQGDIERKINELEANSVEINFMDTYIRALASAYHTIGMGSWLLHADVVAAKKNFYLEAKMQEILFRKYNDKSIPVSASFVVMSSYRRLLAALISDADALIHSLATFMGNRPKEEKNEGHPFANNVGYALKYLLLEEEEKAAEHIETLLGLETKKYMKLLTGYGRTLKGILDRDEQAANQGLTLMLDGYKKERSHRDSPEQFFSVPVVAFAKLVIRKGMKVDSIDDPIVPKELLQIHTIDYPELTYQFSK